MTPTDDRKSPPETPGLQTHVAEAAPRHTGQVSLEGLHGSVRLPRASAKAWRQYMAFAGPAILISVGYMDPGNWSTDLQAGAQFKYHLLWVVGLSSLMAIVLQVIAARLGVVTGKDLAQCCRDHLPRWTRWPNWLSCEIAIAACDLAESMGSAVALHLLFPRISLFVALLITAFDVLLLLALQRFGMRLIEAVILTLVATIGGCFFIEIFVLPQTTPSFPEMGSWLFAPDMPGFFHDKDLVALAIGIIGATVMPHNLYLHSALVQSRQLQADDSSIRRAIRFNTIETTVALCIAFFVNAAIMVLAAMVFFPHLAGAVGIEASGTTLPDGHGGIISINDQTDWIQVAYMTLTPLLGTAAASIFFAIGLLASGQSSTVTGTLAGQVVMEGFMHWKIQPWVRRLITRGIAIAPAILMVGMQGNNANANKLLNFSQMVLALALPLAMFPLLFFVSSKRMMGQYRPGWFLLVTGWLTALLITAMDIYGLPDVWQSGIAVFRGSGGN